MRLRPSAGNAAMAAAALWLLLFGALHVMTGLRASALFSVAPLIVATTAIALITQTAPTRAQ